MKIKRFVGPNMRTVLKMVRENMGDDAIILSNKSLKNGIELVASADYSAIKKNKTKAIKPEKIVEKNTQRDAKYLDFTSAKRAPQDEELDPAIIEMRKELHSLKTLLQDQLADLAWHDKTRRTPTEAELQHRLLDFGLHPSICNNIIAQLRAYGEHDIESLWRQSLQMLSESITVTNDDIALHGGVYALVGTTGVGKTTTVAKLAARYASKHGPQDIGLITADCYRIAAHEQLRTYGRIMNIPVKAVGDANQLKAALEQFKDKKLILIDTAGMGQRDLRLSGQLRLLQEAAPQAKRCLVISAVWQAYVLDATVQAFKDESLHSCIVTRVDESLSLGPVLSTVIKHHLPVAYIADGQRVPEDLRVARAYNLVNRAGALASEYRVGIDETALSTVIADGGG